MSTRESKERCAGEYMALYRFHFSHESSERVFDPGTGDNEITGRMLTHEGQYDVVALTQVLAAAAFHLKFPASIYTLLSGPEFICYVDGVVHVAEYYGGHFS